MTYLPALIAHVLRHRDTPPEVLSDSTFEELHIDALDVSGIALACMNRWNIEIADSTASAWTCVEDVWRTVEELAGECV